ncbi:MAG: hypothetical protein QM726_19195 [Chitinophagaceae bacterium]
MTKWIRLSILIAFIVFAGLTTIKKVTAFLQKKDDLPAYTITLSRGNGYAVLVESTPENCKTF